MAASPADAGASSDPGAADAAAQQFESDRQALIAKFENAERLPAGRAAADKFAADAGVTLTPDDETPCLLTFQVGDGAFEGLVAQHFEALKKNGWYLFRIDRSFGSGDGLDTCGLLPTDDKYEVLTLVQTDGANYDLMPWDIINWLRNLEATQPFVITEAGFDYLAGKFTAPVKDPKALADKMYEFCPDIVDQGVGDVEKLVEEVQKPEPELYFWWD